MTQPLRTWLVRREDTGLMHTVQATTERAAVKAAIDKFKFPVGLYVEIKEREVGDWVRYRCG